MSSKKMLSVYVVIGLLVLLVYGTNTGAKNATTYEVYEGIIKDTSMRPYQGEFWVYLEGRDAPFITDTKSAQKYGLIRTLGDETKTATGTETKTVIDIVMIPTGKGRHVRIKCKKGSNSIVSLEFLPGQKK